MHRSRIMLVTTAVILSLATMAVMSIASATPNSQPDITTAQTFTILAHATNFKMVNVDGKDIGPGDYLVERWALRRSGTPAGRLNSQCTINFNQTPANPTALCSFAFTFSGKGEITAEGSVVFAPAPEGFRPLPFDLAVTGGTGSYQIARGQIHVQFLDVADARFTFHLIPSDPHQQRPPCGTTARGTAAATGKTERQLRLVDGLPPPPALGSARGHARPPQRNADV